MQVGYNIFKETHMKKVILLVSKTKLLIDINFCRSLYKNDLVLEHIRMETNDTNFRTSLYLMVRNARIMISILEQACT